MADKNHNAQHRAIPKEKEQPRRQQHAPDDAVHDTPGDGLLHDPAKRPPGETLPPC